MWTMDQILVAFSEYLNFTSKTFWALELIFVISEEDAYRKIVPSINEPALTLKPLHKYYLFY